MIRVVLPAPLCSLADVAREVTLEVVGPPTHRGVLDAVEAAYPMLRGTLRDQTTKQRRPFIRFYANERDLSHESPDTPLPQEVVDGKEPYLIIGAMSGG